jgi:YidC/Oxa1 family membrane protein insertase
MSVLAPLSYALAAVVAAAHACLTSLGADPASGTTWLLCIAAVVVVVRIALLPLAIHGVRLAHASARARPQLRDLAQRYRNRKDPESLRAFADERRRIASEHGMSRLGFLPILVQIPIWLALYHLLADAAGGASVGTMSPELVASLGAATLLGIPLADRGYLGTGWTHLAVVAGLAGTAAALGYVTQRYLVAPNTVVADLPEALARAHQLMPALSALGVIVAAGVVPVALLVYWVCNAVWTLGQSAVIWRWFPTPGSPAASRVRRS